MLDTLSIDELARDLLAITEGVAARRAEDPFGDPVLSIALTITRRMDNGEITEAQLAALVRHLRDRAFEDRARRIAEYVGGTDEEANAASLVGLAEHLHRPDPADSPVRWAEYRAQVERTRFAAVFTAHPTFSLPVEIGRALAEAACGHAAPGFASHRPAPVSLQDEFAQATAAIANGRDALDRLNAALPDGRPPCLAGSLERPHAAPDDPGELGRLRHRRADRYRLVGHAAAAARDEAAAIAAAARPVRRSGRGRGAGRANAGGAGRGGRADRRLSGPAGAAERLSFRARPGRSARGGAGLARTASRPAARGCRAGGRTGETGAVRGARGAGVARDVAGAHAHPAECRAGA